MPSISELQSITNMWNAIIPRVTEFDNGFTELGNREYLINRQYGRTAFYAYGNEERLQ